MTLLKFVDICCHRRCFLHPLLQKLLKGIDIGNISHLSLKDRILFKWHHLFGFGLIIEYLIIYKFVFRGSGENFREEGDREDVVI